jgi:hypothetical protein
MSDVLTRSRDRKSEGITRRRYKAQIIAEIITGLSQEDAFTNRDHRGWHRERALRTCHL